MEITTHDALTVVHGMVFGAALLLGFSGLAAWLYAAVFATAPWRPSRFEQRMLTVYFGAMAGLAWIAVLVGAYVIYPWYRAKMPPGAPALEAYPRQFLLAHPALTGWHDVGMEWKEHLAWFAPICLTAATSMFARYGTDLRTRTGLRGALLGLCIVAFAAAAISGFFGAMLNKFAPVRGGATIVLMKGQAHER